MFIPWLFKRAVVLGPMPHNLPTSRGARNLFSVPGNTTVNPLGLLISEAILEVDLLVLIPTEIVKHKVSSIVCFSWLPILYRSSGSFIRSVISRYASSMERGSISEENLRNFVN